MIISIEAFRICYPTRIIGIALVIWNRWCTHVEKNWFENVIGWYLLKIHSYRELFKSHVYLNLKGISGVNSTFRFYIRFLSHAKEKWRIYFRIDWRQFIISHMIEGQKVRPNKGGPCWKYGPRKEGCVFFPWSYLPIQSTK